jgi:hypothetical protein
VLALLEGLRRDRARQRKLDLFFTMLRNRRLWLAGEWVGGLNLIMVEFADQPEVIDALNKLLDGFSNPAWQGSEAVRQRLILDTEAHVCTLLARMAAALRYDLKVSDLRSRSLTPMGWSADEVQARQSRDLLQLVLAGARPLRVEVAAPRNGDGGPVVKPAYEEHGAAPP